MFSEKIEQLHLGTSPYILGLRPKIQEARPRIGLFLFYTTTPAMSRIGGNTMPSVQENYRKLPWYWKAAGWVLVIGVICVPALLGPAVGLPLFLVLCLLVWWLWRV